MSVDERLRSIGVVPVVVLPDVAAAVPLAEALVAAGLPCAEITYRTPAAREGLRAIRRAFPEILLGAGTILDEEQLADAVEGGADFLVAPGMRPEIVRAAQARDVPMLAGVCTPTEIEAARALGQRLMKFFPSEPLGGAGFLRALCGPYPDVSFVPTGGITPAVLADYLAISQVVACGGSWMVSPQLLRDGAFDRVRALAEEARALVGQAR